jgi:hypothetical protein
MNTKRKWYEQEYALRDAPGIKTIGLRIGVSDSNLEATIKRAFDPARSAGRELSLTVSAGDPRQARRPTALFVGRPAPRLSG